MSDYLTDPTPIDPAWHHWRSLLVCGQVCASYCETIPGAVYFGVEFAYEVRRGGCAETRQSRTVRMTLFLEKKILL